MSIGDQDCGTGAGCCAPTPSDKDRERARGFVDNERFDASGVAEQFAQVRAEEREKVVGEIVAWIRAELCPPWDEVTIAGDVADEIERKWGGK